MMRTILSSLAVAAMVSAMAIEPTKSDHAAAFVPKFEHSPTDPMDGIIEVKLNANGNWVGGNSDTVFWRFMLAVEKAWYAYPPPHGPFVHANVTLRAMGSPKSLSCKSGDICEGQWVGENHQHVVTNMLVNALWPDSPRYRTLETPAYKVLQGEGSPGDRCQTSRNLQMANGASLHKLLSEGFTVEYKALALMFTGGSHNTDHNWVIATEKEIEVPLTIRCLGNSDVADKIDPQPKSSLIADLQVTGAALSITPGNKYETECPVDIVFHGNVQVSGALGATPVEYRFEWATGERSIPFTTTVQAGDATANVVHQVAIPLTAAVIGQPQGGNGGGGAGGIGAGGLGAGGLAAQMPDFDSGDFPPPSKGPQLKGETVPSNEHKNDVRMRILSHGGGKIVSNAASYHIVCEPKTAINPVGPMTVPEQPVEPVNEPAVVIAPPPPPSPKVITDPPVPQLVCAGGRVVGSGRRASCRCPRGQEAKQVGRNRFQCERTVARITCTGGTVRRGECFCARNLRKVQTGRNAWRCERPAAKTRPDTTTIRPAAKTRPDSTRPARRVICQGGTVRRGECVCPRGTEKAPMAPANAYRCVGSTPQRGSTILQQQQRRPGSRAR